MAVTLLCSLFVFIEISDRVERKYLNPVFEVMDQLELESALNALNSGGPVAVSNYMQRLNGLFGTSHYLVDRKGVDIASGESRQSLLPLPPLSKSRGIVNGQFVVTHRSADGQYWFIAVNANRTDRWTFFPYYLLVIGATGLLCWLGAVGIVSPIRKVTSTVKQFGQGNLASRIHLGRRDEIGSLARAFDEMADRLEKLVTGERRLLQDISHELRSPLARLKFSVKLARTAAEPGIALDRVERDVDRIASLVSEIVEVAGIEDAPSSRQQETFGLTELIEETVRDCAVEAEFRGLSLRVLDKPPIELVGFPELLRRAIENVLRNAIRYSPEQATVDISLNEAAETAVISVRDYGPGVPAESLGRIFDPFFRVDEERDTNTGSVGLGLSIAKRAVHLHRGTIIAENAFPGLRVQLRIPLVARPT